MSLSKPLENLIQFTKKREGRDIKRDTTLAHELAKHASTEVLFLGYLRFLMTAQNEPFIILENDYKTILPEIIYNIVDGVIWERTEGSFSKTLPHLKTASLLDINTSVWFQTLVVKSDRLKSLTIQNTRQNKIIIDTPNLRHLSLLSMSLDKIELNVPNLRHLSLCRIQGASAIRISAEHLRSLIVTSCGDLREVIVEGAELDVFLATKCPELKTRPAAFCTEERVGSLF